MLHEIEAIGNQARICRENLNAGDLCCIEGHLEGEIGARRIVAERVIFLSRRLGDTIAQTKQAWEIGIRRGGEYRIAQG